MDTFAGAVLLVLGIVAFNNYRAGTLPDWARAKFFNSAAPPPTPAPGGGGGGATARFASTTSPPVSLRAPVSGPVTGRFGDRRSTGVHQGIDWAVPIGTPVAAASSGRVIAAGPAGTYGNRVDIDHGGGLVTRYAHLDRITTRLGAVVEAGQAIATSGNTGRSTGPHLHFEVRVNGRAVDPAGYLAAGPVGVLA